MENDNSTSQDEQKKWLISRIDQIHKTVSDQISSMERRFDKLGEKELSRLKGRRNDTLYILGLILAIIITIHQSSDDIDLIWLITILVLLILGFLILFNIYISLTNSYFHYFMKQFAVAEGAISHSSAYFTIETRDLKKINTEFLHNFSEFARNISSISLIPVFIVIVEGSKKKWLKGDVKEELNENIKPLVDLIEAGKSQYLEMNKTKFPKYLIDFFAVVIPEYEKIRNTL